MRLRLRMTCLFVSASLVVAAGVVARAGTGTLSAPLPDPLPPPQTSAAMPADPVPSATNLVVRAHAAIMTPAPLPDPDVAPPEAGEAADAGAQEASLHPDFFSMRNHFAGDGYASGSAIESDQNHRRTPGGGMSLSIPVTQ